MSLVENLFYKLDGFQLNISQLEILDHGITVLAGPSGVGKSTILRILMGLESCPSLSWRMGDLDLAKLSPPERRIGVVFQSYELFPHLSARDNILFAAKARKLPSEQIDSAIAELSNNLHMEGFLHRRADQLSGGERQRVALARALIGNVRILFLDEPFSALDQSLRAEARALVKQVITSKGIPALMVTHDPADISAIGDAVIQMTPVVSL